VRSLSLAVATALLVALSGCDVFSSEDDSGTTVSGEIINTTDRGVDGAEVEFSQGGEVEETTTANDTGYYEVSGLNQGEEYDVSVNARGYNQGSFSITVSESGDTEVPSQELLGSADVNGTVADASTGGGLANAEVAFTFGESPSEVDTSRSEADLITTTDDDGEYSIPNAPTGEYVCVVRASGFAPAVVPDIEFDEGDNDVGQTSTSEALAEGQVRIVLEWGERPSDLDSHLTGPAEPSDDSDRFHVYYVDREYPADSSTAFLDRDDVTSFGPETVTINTLREGTYRYSVFNFSDQTDDGAVGIDSSARVTVFDEGGQRARYTAPSAEQGDGNTWRVVEINVSGDGSVSFDDNGGDTFGYYEADNSGDLTTFRKGTKDLRLTPELSRALRRAFDRPVSSF
jgi:hypothetical protein